MYPLSILVALAGGLVAFAVGHEESSANTCTTTATVSVTTDILPSIAARSSSIPTALPATVPESLTSAPSATGPLDILTGSAFDSAISSLVASFPTGQNFGTTTLPDTTYSIPSVTPITNISDLSTPAPRSTISLTNNNTTSTASTTTSTSSASSITTSTSSTSSVTTSKTSRGTSTSTAAPTTSSASQPANAATGLPANSANLALAVVAGAMLLL